MSALKDINTRPKWSLDLTRVKTGLSISKLLQWASVGELILCIDVKNQSLLLSKDRHVANEDLQYGIPAGDAHQFKENYSGVLQLRENTINRLRRNALTQESRFTVRDEALPFAQTIGGARLVLERADVFIMPNDLRSFLLVLEGRKGKVASESELLSLLPSSKTKLASEIQSAYVAAYLEKQRRPKTDEVYSTLRKLSGESAETAIIGFMPNKAILWKVSSADKTEKETAWKTFQDRVSKLNTHFSSLFES